MKLEAGPFFFPGSLTCQLLDVYAADTDSDADDAWDEPLGDSFRRAGPPPARGRDGARLAVAAG